ASDPEIGVGGDTLSYSITGGNGLGGFAINSSTGQITVANPAVLDFETTPSFALTVTIADNGTTAAGAQAALNTSITVNISLTDVNEYDPTVPSGQSFSIAENSANSAVVGTVTASDQDTAQTWTFAIINGGTVSTNSTGAFAINAATGQITVNNSAALNFE